MPSYFYHLKFELYATPSPASGDNTGSLEAQPKDLWLPPQDADIFDGLPSHTRKRPSFPLRQPAATANLSIATRNQEKNPALIDCGAPRPAEADNDRDLVILSERQFRQRTLSFPPPQSYAAIKPQTAVKDWRFGRISIESVDAEEAARGDTMAGSASSAAAAVGPSMAAAGKATKAKYVPFTTKNTDIGWGIVHLYREGAEAPELGMPRDELDEASEGEGETSRTDCTTLCIPAVPSYLSPSDFLGFVGEKWREQISHFRMVMTGRMNRYLVLMKFRDSRRAQRFRHEFDGRVFNDIEPETCNVAFIRSITFDTPTRAEGSFPDLSHDPFTPPSDSPSNLLKPFPPPTPDLVELPTCPVCLERMDDTTGLLTIPCQHVFHCSCLQKWKGSGCPVCRHTNPSLSSLPPSNANSYSSSSHPTAPYDPSDPFSQPFGSHISNLCSVCDCTDDLWICLICGNVGCGRYKGGHAKEHWKDTAHTFSLELDTQHVWDYAGDMWVHRLIRNKGDGKLVELPGRHEGPGDVQEDVVPRAKLDSISMEYTHLLTSQLESQRVYFEEMLSKAADKIASASAAAEAAAAEAAGATKELRKLREEQQSLREAVIPDLEKDLSREKTRATKSTELARGLGKSLQEEKKVSEGLMKRIEHVAKETEALTEQVKGLKAENEDLKDQNHDLTMFISGQQKLKEMEAEGQVDSEELEEGTAGVPEKKGRKGKGRAKG